MPRGITDQFLTILQTETRRGWAALAWGLVGLLVALALADLADRPRFGDVTGVYVVSVLLVTLLAALWARREAVARTRDLEERWQAWMRFSVSSGSIRDIERKVQNLPPPSPWIASLVVALAVLANGVVFALLWFEAPVAMASAFGMAVLNGAGVGWLLGTVALRLHWARSASKAATELVGSGAIGVWGER